MRVDYFCGYRRFSTWVCFGHEPKSFPRRQAENWWRSHGGQGPAPTDIDSAVEASAQLNKPKFLRIEKGGRYDTIKAYDFVGTRFELHPDLGGPPLEDPGPDPLEALTAQAKTASFYQGGDSYYDDDIPF
jgi:hypothetical protein